MCCYLMITTCIADLCSVFVTWYKIGSQVAILSPDLGLELFWNGGFSANMGFLSFSCKTWTILNSRNSNYWLVLLLGTSNQPNYHRACLKTEVRQSVEKKADY